MITGHWSGEPVSYDGEHFTLEEAQVLPTSVQEPRVPILAGYWWPDEKPFRRGARWDGIMAYFASLTEGTGPHGEEPAGSPEEEVMQALVFYNDIADEPSDVLVPTIPSIDTPEYSELCKELGATWALATNLG